MSADKTPPAKAEKFDIPEPEIWMRDAAEQIIREMGIEPFDQVVPAISGIIARHYKLRETAAERAKAYLAEHEKWLAKKNADLALKKRLGKAGS